MIENTELIVPEDGAGWQVHYAFFSRSGFAAAALSRARDHQAIMVDLKTLGETRE